MGCRVALENSPATTANIRLIDPVDRIDPSMSSLAIEGLPFIYPYVVHHSDQNDKRLSNKNRCFGSRLVWIHKGISLGALAI